MKKITINILGLTLLLGLGACKKHIELYPYASIESSQSFQTVKDATTWNNGLYSDLRGRIYAGYNIPQEVQADYLNATLDYGNRNGNPHRWGVSLLSDDGIFSGTWGGFYSGLKNINNCIAGFDKIVPANATETAQLNQYKGDAYLARAYYYSELIIRFAKPYEPATAASDPGVPLVLGFDLEAKPARATVKQVYDQILADIAQAKTLLAGVTGAQGSVKFTIDAVNCLDARVRLNMQDWAGAMAASNAVINTGKYPLITTVSEFTNMWTTDIVKESVVQLAVKINTETPPTNAIYLGFRAADSKFAPDFLPTQSFLDMYQSTDIRKAVYFAAKPVIIQGINYPGLVVVNKYPGNPALFTTAATNYQNAPKVFRIAEQYLIYAEAAQRAGGANEALAIARINELRLARGASLITGLTGTPLRDEIRNERTRELAFEGFRLWDLKRWHLGFTRGTPQNLQPIQQGANFNLLSIPADENKFVWAIPSREVTLNSALTQNPGY